MTATNRADSESIFTDYSYIDRLYRPVVDRNCAMYAWLKKKEKKEKEKKQARINRQTKINKHNWRQRRLHRAETPLISQGKMRKPATINYFRRGGSLPV